MDDWISVKGQLPKDDTTVLVTYYLDTNPKKRYVEEAWYYNENWTLACEEYMIGRDKVVVLAWMPMPKVYKGD